MENKLATTEDIPEGTLVVRGRLVVADHHLAVIPDVGRPTKLYLVEGFDLAGETGDEVLVTAVMRESGWAAWLVRVTAPAAALPALEKGLLEKLTTVKAKKEKTFDNLDYDVAKNQTSLDCQSQQDRHHPSRCTSHSLSVRVE